MKKLTGRDLIAAILIIGCLTLIGLDKDHVVEYVLLSVATAYGLVQVVTKKNFRKLWQSLINYQRRR